MSDTTCRECNRYIYSKYGWTSPVPHIDFGGTDTKTFVICLSCFEETYKGDYHATRSVYNEWRDLEYEQRDKEREANKKVCGFIKKDGKSCKREVSRYSSSKHCRYHGG